jgi:hypothetical protein
MAFAICPARQGQQRSLRRMCQVLSWAVARSPGARSLAWAEAADDAPSPGGGQVMHAAGQLPVHPQARAVRAGDDLQVHAVLLVPARVERPVFRDPVDRIRVPSITTNACPARFARAAPGPASGRVRRAGAWSR